MKQFRWVIVILLFTATRASAQPVPKPATKPATLTVLPATPGDHKLKFATYVDGHLLKMAYLLYLPVNYTAATEPCPVVVFLHGGGEAGEDLSGVSVHGPNMNLERAEYAKFRQTFPFIVVSPQCPPRGERWDQPKMIKVVIALLEDLGARLPKFDKDRVYLTGLSMGGKGTWLIAEEAPSLFAAIAPMDADTLKLDLASKLKYTPVWMGAGQDDGGVVENTRQMDAALRKTSHAEIKRTVLPHIGHGAWSAFYESAQFYEWFLQYRRPTDKEKKEIDARPLPSANDPPAPLPQEFGHHALSFTTKIGDRTEAVPYTIFLPRTYSPTGDAKPLILFLHEQIAIGMPYKGMCLHGPDAELEKKGNEQFKGSFASIVVSPKRLPEFPKWDQPEMTPALIALVDDVCAKYHVDKKRVYVTGLNEGGAGTWMLACKAPERFAAILPVIAEGNFSPPGNAGTALKDVPTWAFEPASDGGGMQSLGSMFKTFRADWTLTPVSPANVIEATNGYRQPKIYEWMLKHHKT